MKKTVLYLVSMFFLVISVTGCACKSWDWHCTSECGWQRGMKPLSSVEVEAPVVAKVEPAVVKVEPAVVKVEPVVAKVEPVAVKAEPVVAKVEPVVVAPVVKAEPVAEVISAAAVGARNFGDHRSSTLTTKAWQSLALKDTDGVSVYTNKCIDMYAVEAAKMQAGLKEYPAGDAQSIFGYWALNDVATSLFIQGEAYRKAKEFDKAKAAYNRVINEFSFGQAYDPASKTFWKPAEGAQEGLFMIEKGLDLDFGDMTSQTIVRRMWASLSKKNLDEVVAYGSKLERLYGKTAKEMGIPLKEYPQLPAEKIHMYWALNDVGTGIFILGEAYNAAGMKTEAKAAYQKVVTDYFYAQCWDPQGWFWKPADAAQQKVFEIEAVK